MPNELLIDDRFGEFRVALLRDDTLFSFGREWTDQPSRIGALFAGRVTEVLSAQDLAFVDCGLEQNVALRASDCPNHKLPNQGARVLLQYGRDPMRQKGPRGSLLPQLIGFTQTYLPLGHDLTVSRRLSARPRDRDQVQTSYETLADWKSEGVRLHCAAAKAGCRVVEGELAQLRAKWRAATARFDKSNFIGCCLPGPSLPLRLLCDADFPVTSLRVRCNTSTTLRSIQAEIEQTIPDLDTTFSHHTDQQPIFTHHAIEEELDMLTQPQVRLRAGGAITIEETTALMAIDVDAGGTRGIGGSVKSARQTNLAAASEIGRQLRLRNIGGLIAIDFIDLERPSDQKAIIRALHKAVADDPMPVSIGTFSRFGLVDMTRKRQTHSTVGAGTPREIVAKALRGLQARGPMPPGGQAIVVVAPEVASLLNGVMRSMVEGLAADLGGQVSIRSDPDTRPTDFEIIR